MFTRPQILTVAITFSHAILLMYAWSPVQAAQILIQTGDPQLTGVVTTVWRNGSGDAVHNFLMPAHGNMSSADMAASTVQSLLSVPGADPASVTLAGNHVNVMSTPLLDPLDGVFPGGSVYWSAGGTAQERTVLSSPDVEHASIAAAGIFQPFFQPQLPAVFTAGIVTDVGELTAHITAQELNFQTDGPIICQALFQRLAPRAPQYGAQINYAGDRLEVYFDPAYTVTQGGIIFGTTSPSPGFSGTVVVPPGPLPGDYNQDGSVDAGDYVLWRKMLGQQVPAGSGADGNGNGLVDPLDYSVWQTNFGRPPGRNASLATTSVPEPTGAALGACLGVVATFTTRYRPRSRRHNRQRHSS